MKRKYEHPDLRYYSLESESSYLLEDSYTTVEIDEFGQDGEELTY